MIEYIYMERDAKKHAKPQKKQRTSSRKPSEEAREHKITWRAPEYVFQEKGSDWYWILGIIVATLAILALLMNNVLFMVFTLLAGITLALYGSRKPEIYDFEVNTKGVRVNNKLFPYFTLDYFWIDESGPQTVLILESKHAMMQHIIIPIEGVRSDELRMFLEAFLPEEYIERSWPHQLMERLGL